MFDFDEKFQKRHSKLSKNLFEFLEPHNTKSKKKTGEKGEKDKKEEDGSETNKENVKETYFSKILFYVLKNNKILLKDYIKITLGNNNETIIGPNIVLELPIDSSEIPDQVLEKFYIKRKIIFDMVINYTNENKQKVIIVYEHKVVKHPKLLRIYDYSKYLEWYKNSGKCSESYLICITKDYYSPFLENDKNVYLRKCYKRYTWRDLYAFFLNYEGSEEKENSIYKQFLDYYKKRVIEKGEKMYSGVNLSGDDAALLMGIPDGLKIIKSILSEDIKKELKAISSDNKINEKETQYNSIVEHKRYAYKINLDKNYPGYNMLVGIIFNPTKSYKFKNEPHVIVALRCGSEYREKIKDKLNPFFNNEIEYKYWKRFEASTHLGAAWRPLREFTDTNAAYYPFKVREWIRERVSEYSDFADKNGLTVKN